MKTLIAYYSRTGANESLAQELQKRLKADMERIEDVKGYSGPIGFIKGGRDATKKKVGEIKPFQKDPSKYDLVIMLTPFWAGLVPPAIRAYVSQNKFKKVALASVSGSGEENKDALPDFEKLAGRTVASMLLSKKEFETGAYKQKLEGFVRKIS